MAKVRVYELAKEFGVESKAVLAKLNEMGEFVRSASSTIEAPVVRRLQEAFNQGSEGGKKSGSSPKPGPRPAASEVPRARRPPSRGPRPSRARARPPSPPRRPSRPRSPAPPSPARSPRGEAGPRPGGAPKPGPQSGRGERPQRGERAERAERGSRPEGGRGPRPAGPRPAGPRPGNNPFASNEAATVRLGTWLPSASIGAVTCVRVANDVTAATRNMAAASWSADRSTPNASTRANPDSANPMRAGTSFSRATTTIRRDRIRQPLRR
ncbi:translation initiation factor IF-2 N-terminal domain-containing protein [Nocardiopsis sp. CNR-923]|uniref:translation initiation factor IF-2 N-terminal domain-containing protein n=1 Tax=Nocardiopsis sp. CNR-923 TaxID=1904965 RepID=UPI00096AB110|nr:translation initiation factor IF-2 N-terminal domain-containing protein [Nocardiopsis sp. CNR-923]